MQTVKRIALGLLVLLMSTGIYMILVDSKGLKKSVLQPTLEALGNQLFAAVAEDDEKATLKNRYSEFVRQAVKQEIPTQQIEKVAAGILNLSMEESTLSSQDALHLLFLPPAVSAAGIGAGVSELPPVTDLADIPGFRVGKSTGRVVRIDPDELAQRLERMKTFHDEYKKIAQKNHLFHQLRTHLMFSADSGLRVLINDDVKVMIKSDQFKDISREFADLEKKQLVRWQHRDSLNRYYDQFTSDSVFAAKIKKLVVKMRHLQKDTIVVHVSEK
jgi:hypothetical protein